MGIYDSIRDNYNSECDITARRNIQDIVRSYHHFWDPFSELIQNSVDAINRRYRILNDPYFYLYDIYREKNDLPNDPNYTGKILIEVWPSEKRLKVSDNGTGIQNERICKLMCPDCSDKRKGQEYGYKGKGLTFASFITKRFCIMTKFFLSMDTYHFEVNDLYHWLQDDSGAADFPIYPMSEPAITDKSISDYNTSVELELEGDYSFVSDDNPTLDNVFSMFLSERAIDCFSTLLRTKTALGNTRSLFGKNPIVPINAVLKVYDDAGSVSYDKPLDYRFFHPKDVDLYASMSFEFNNYVNNLTNGSERFSCLYFSTSEPKAIGERRPIMTNFHVIMISATNLSTLNEYLGFGDYDYYEPISHAGLRPGIYLSIDGMPTGIRIDDWSKRGAELKKYYVIADCELSISNELDAGRKGISEGRAKLISDAAYELIETYRATSNIDNITPIGNTFHTYSKYLQYSGDASDTDDFENKIRYAQEQSQSDRDNLSAVYSYLLSHTSLLHTPTNEEEVRALFHELLSKNIIKGYKTIYAAANRADYDEAFKYDINLNDSILEDGDPIGIPRVVQFNNGRNNNSISLDTDYRKMGLSHSDALCVEFKYHASDLIREIRTNPTSSKDPNRIDILIAWDIDGDTIRRISPSCGISPIVPDRKYLHSTTHRLIISTPDVNTSVFVISLIDILRALTT